MSLFLAKYKLALALILAGGVFIAGWTVRGYIADAREAFVQTQIAAANARGHRLAREAEQAARVAEQESAARVAALGDVVALEAKLQRARDDFISSEVLRYAQNTDRPACHLDGEFVRIHDRGAVGASGAGEVSDPSATAVRVDAGAAYVTDADALLTITRNYGRFQVAAAQVAGLQQYIRTECLRE